MPVHKEQDCEIQEGESPMTEDQRPHNEAERVRVWWDSLDKEDQRRVREINETGSELPVDLVKSLCDAGIYPAGPSVGPCVRRCRVLGVG